jgi:large subunit ribosomal protein L15
MQIHQLKRKTKLKKGRYIGRGGKRGTTSGRGTKGQKARAGHKIRPEIRDRIKKLPKLRGYRFRSRVKPSPVNLSQIEKKFSAGETVNIETLAAKKILTGKIGAVKILGTGKLTKAVTIVGCKVSLSAKAKVEQAGGKIVE